ncbi:MAG: DUF4130 domain-containing protein, partial [Oscillospiraceae bacterium]
PAQDFQAPAPGQEERAYRALWRRFYDTIAIQGRYNPKLRQNHMPKRYWKHLTEFQEDDKPPAPQERRGRLAGPQSASV